MELQQRDTPRQLDSGARAPAPARRGRAAGRRQQGGGRLAGPQGRGRAPGRLACERPKRHWQLQLPGGRPVRPRRALVPGGRRPAREWATVPRTEGPDVLHRLRDGRARGCPLRSGRGNRHRWHEGPGEVDLETRRPRRDAETDRSGRGGLEIVQGVPDRGGVCAVGERVQGMAL